MEMDVDTRVGALDLWKSGSGPEVSIEWCPPLDLMRPLLGGTVTSPCKRRVETGYRVFDLVVVPSYLAMVVRLIFIAVAKVIRELTDQFFKI